MRVKLVALANLSVYAVVDNTILGVPLMLDLVMGGETVRLNYTEAALLDKGLREYLSGANFANQCIRSCFLSELTEGEVK